VPLRVALPGVSPSADRKIRTLGGDTAVRALQSGSTRAHMTAIAGIADAR
jgi:hypothetical protein